ncbi:MULTISPECIES: GlxA family transcriptional regulator [unclassified Delftia]|uniref:GlxA family transcriptional regulator n=1 Tax=unclassified Delftia TaxID=2613839 RepID=UPI001902816A|nr:MULTISPECIES: helix-turn-helix domain-containing protein [unclassified Delftia]MBK0113759.1 helix-turn-helix domain-containing protein [Delftia sp. S65]MBK0119623.1 helix-turn-helix domain-containing protein [Delftia sp. S67]MBK0131487.1 helix-turn-helix domain-containing protein [Delftia sp. S66]
MDHRHASAHRIDLVVYPGFKALEAIGPMSVFDYANVHLRARGQSDGYEVRVVSQRQGPVRSDTLMSLEATHTLAGLEAAGMGCTVVVVGSRHIEQVLGGSAELVAWLGRVAPRVQRLIALCSGSFFLAEAGLLDGRRAATHWSVTAQLAQRHPRVQVDADAIYLREEIRDGAGSRQLWTSAGVTAGIDLALAVVEEDFGHALALEVARDLVMYLKRPGGQSQFSVPLAAQAAQHGGVQAVQQWVMAHLAEPLTLTQMAEQAHMSERHLRRVFQQETGQSPTAFVESARLEAAKQLLESQAHLPLKTVAARVGLGSEQALRHLFVRHLGITPVAYRDRFGGRGGAG